VGENAKKFVTIQVNLQACPFYKDHNYSAFLNSQDN
jgi:hypothetical protein